MKQLRPRIKNAQQYSTRTLVLLVLTTLSCILGVNVYMSALEAQIEAKGHFIAVVTAARNLEPGETIELKDVAYTKIPQTACIDGGYVSGNAHDLVGKRVNIFMQRGDQISNAKLGEASAPSSFGKRWYLLRDASMASSNALKQGDRVDIIGVVDTPDGTLQSSTIIQNVIVSSLVSKGSELYSLDGGSSGVIIEVTLEQAQRLALAEELGTITLVKRAGDDILHEKVLTVTGSDLTASPIMTKEPKYQRFEVISGTDSELLYLPAMREEIR